MRMTCIFLLCLFAVLWAPAPAQASVGDLTVVIEGFVAKQYPGARSHFWVVNGAQWESESELVVDLNTFVVNRHGQAGTEDRFLLLIVEGKVAAAQNIPLNAGADCKQEQT
jgi:hypothetical protein